MECLEHEKNAFLKFPVLIASVKKYTKYANWKKIANHLHYACEKF